MSNLVKQYFVVKSEEKEGPVVINSNARMEEHFKRLAKEREEEEKRLEREVAEAEQFREGLNPEVLEAGMEGVSEEEVMEPLQTGPTYEEIVKDANEEAMRIIASANEEASRILAEAKENAAVAFEEQKQAGYLAGEQMLQEELATARMQLEKQYDDQVAELQEQYVQKLSGMERDITEAIIKVFDHVFHMDYSTHGDILLYLVDSMVQNIRVGKSFKIYASSEDLPLVEAHLSELKEKVGQDVEIELLYDAALFAGGCRIETETGVFDCGIDTELSNIYKDIRMICG